MVRAFASNPKLKGSNLMSGGVCGMLIEYSHIEFLKEVLRLIMWPT